MKRAIAVLICSLILVVNPFHVAQARHGGTVAILMPGAGGAVPSDFLMRNRKKFSRAGIRTIITTSPDAAVSISRSERSKGHRVALIGMSRGAIHAARALASGASVSRVVFVSGNFRMISSILGTPALLPPTLIVQHRHDQCRYTNPQAASRFIRWSKGKARIRWINTSGTARSGPCGPFAAHGFFGQDKPAVAAIIGFIR